MTTTEFECYVTKGLGRAVTLLRDVGEGLCPACQPADFYAIIFRAATTHMGYDAQCEGDRAFYARELLRAVGDPPELIHAVIAHADAVTAETYVFDVSHYAALLGILYNEGLTEADTALEGIYSRALDALLSRKHPFEDRCIDNELEFYRFITACIVKIKDTERLGRIFSDFAALIDLRGGELFNALDFELFFDRLDAHKDGRNAVTTPEAERLWKSYDTLTQKRRERAVECTISQRQTPDEYFEYTISGGEIESGYRLKMDALTPEQCETLARFALDTTDIRRKHKLLLMFTRRNSSIWPLGPVPLIDLSREYIKYLADDGYLKYFESDKDSVNSALAFTLLCVLRQLRSEPVREYAIELAREGSVYAADLWVENFRAGDEDAFTAYVKSFPVIHNLRENNCWHGVQMSALKLSENNKNNRLDELLRYIYETHYCSCCRYSAVHQLAKKGLLDDVMRAECAFDSYNRTRELALR